MNQTAFAFADPVVAATPGLRDYQQEALQAIKQGVLNKVRRQLVVLPTGTGKSVVFRHIPEMMGWKRTLLLVHRVELVDQAAGHFALANKGKSIAVERAHWHAEKGDDIVTACVATMRGTRLTNWKPDHFDGIICDEVHHGMSASWTSILRHFRAQDLDGPVVVGFTATPFRGDGKPLANLFDEVVYSKGIREMIEKGWLANLRAVRVHSDVDLSNLHTKYGDFADEELGRLANVDGRNSLIVSAIEQHAKDRNSIMVFGVNVAHVESLTRQLKDRHHDAECILGKTPELDRKRILRDFNKGTLRILVSCGVLTEGVDIPRADCAVLARPWKSSLGYIQQVGRILRPHEDKPDALIIDVVDVVGRHVIQTATKLFGVRDVDVLGKDVLSVVKRIEELQDDGFAIEDGDSIDEVDLQAKTIDALAKGVAIIPTVAVAANVFHRTMIAGEVLDASAFPWVGIGKDTWLLRMRDKQKLYFRGDTLGRWTVGDDQHNPTNFVRFLGSHAEPPWKLADQAVRECDYEFARMKKLDARWRGYPASDKQKQLLMRMGFRALPAQLTKGAAADLFDVVFARKGRRAA